VDRGSGAKNRIKQFVVDGEAVVLGVDGVPDFNALHSRKHDEEVQLYAFDVLALDGEELRGVPLSLRKTDLARLLARRPDGIFIAPSSRARSAPTCSAPPAIWDLKGWCRNVAIAPIAAGEAPIGSR
jgi:bifunctional non-homologous end joining protein LigD